MPSSTSQSLNDKAWETLFSERHILQDINTNGVHSISASVINVRREARLMTKLDHRINRPQIFKDNGLSILPNSRSSYLIGRFDCYADLPQVAEVEVEEKPFPNWVESLQVNNLYSEASALLCAQHAGLIEDVLGEEVALTVFGRMSTGEFDFLINRAGVDNESSVKWPLAVNKAQCEIDGGFEGSNSFAIVEVKNEEINDFHIRQLYYPYRLWAGKLNKPIVPIFLTYSTEIFSFYVYNFSDQNDYNSLELVKTKRYQVVPTDIEISDVRRILAQTIAGPEPNSIPFPQADRFERVINLLSQLAAANGTLTQEEVTTLHAFDNRQTQYYSNAGRYLGLVARYHDAERGVVYSLTLAGVQIMNKPAKARNLALVEIILSRRIFREALEYYLAHATSPPIEVVVEIMRSGGLEISDTTLPRRAGSVKGWLRWIISLTV